MIGDEPSPRNYKRISRARKIFPAALGALVLLLSAVHGEARAQRQRPESVALGAHVSDRYTADLDSILERRYLRILTSRNSFDYFIGKGHHGGYQYEMARSFTAHLNEKYSNGRQKLKIQFELLPVQSDMLIPMLLSGRGDMIAARLTVTPEREKLVQFSVPYRSVDEVVVSGPAASDAGFVHDLAGLTVAVREGSSYFESLVALNRKFESEGRRPIRIERVDGEIETEKILELVSAGRFEYTVADSIIAETAIALFPELHLMEGLTVRDDGMLAWATHHSSKQLLAEMNEFLPRYREGSLLGNIAVKKYFRDYTGVQARIQSGDTVRLSAHDDSLRKYSTLAGFDWRLMAAMAFQESRFEQKARNRSGAVGLFQIKPSTAREPYIGIHDVAGEENADNNVNAGIKYLAWIKNRYFDKMTEMRERDRMRMALAAYNAGPRTLINARRKAEKMGLDPTRWFRNVELALLSMGKPEPVKYVSEINQRYLSYIMLGVK